MSLSVRHFLVSGDEVRPLTRAVNDRLRRGEILLPQYAGRDLHIVDVTLEMENRSPVGVRRVETATVSLDRQGGVKSRLFADLRASLATARGKSPVRAERWSPSKEQMDRITALALGRRKSPLRPPRPAAVTAKPLRAPEGVRYARRGLDSR